MSVRTYSYLRDKDIKLSDHFSVWEFVSKSSDGKVWSDEVLISEGLVVKLEKLYTTLNCSKIIITSGYRTPAHDKYVDGSGSGQHTLGRAADIVCYGKDGNPISAKLVCCTLEDFGDVYGIGYIGPYSTHLDTRSVLNKWWGDESVKGFPSISRIKSGYKSFYDYFGITRAEKIPQNNTPVDTVTKDMLEDTTLITPIVIDVSYANGVINWAKVKESDILSGVIMRAGYGKDDNQVDAQFEANYKGCKDNNIPCGAYWFSYATTPEDTLKEAVQCAKALAGKQFELPIFFDVEGKTLVDADTVEKNINTFCLYLENLGYWVGIYSNDNAFDNNIKLSLTSRYSTWVARVENIAPKKCKRYDVWQYSWKGQIAGIDHDVDMNYLFTDFKSLIVDNGKNGFGSIKSVNVSEAPVQNNSKDSYGPNPDLTSFDFIPDPVIGELQRILNKKGSSLNVDNKAGINTFNAVKTYTIENGDKGPLTKWTQKRLNSLGFNCGTVDGIAGKNTMSAIASFQKQHGLGVGYLGGSDWFYLIR